jgi:hypothetical protein
MSSSRKRGSFAFLVRVAVFALVFGAVAEIWFRTVMPACEMPDLYQQQPATIYRFDPYQSTVGLYTVSRLCRHAGWWRINDAGWNSTVEYLSAAKRKRPLVALFGDSYIEGLLSDADKHVDAYLPKMLPGTDSYAFGVSGWYLEQYVAVSRYARERFQPDVLVIFIGGGDVSDSLRSNGVVEPYWWQIGPRGASFEELSPTAVKTVTRKVRLAKMSAVLRYLRYNARLTLPGMPNAGVSQPGAEGGAPGEGGAAGAVGPTDSAWRNLVPAADYMVGLLCVEHPGTPIVFVFEGDRYLPPQAVAGAPVSADVSAVRQACRTRSQCFVLDLRPVFSRDWAANHRSFEAADGAHWNAYANRLVAGALARFVTDRGLLDDIESGS